MNWLTRLFGVDPTLPVAPPVVLVERPLPERPVMAFEPPTWKEYNETVQDLQEQVDFLYDALVALCNTHGHKEWFVRTYGVDVDGLASLESHRGWKAGVKYSPELPDLDDSWRRLFPQSGHANPEDYNRNRSGTAEEKYWRDLNALDSNICRIALTLFKRRWKKVERVA